MINRVQAQVWSVFRPTVLFARTSDSGAAPVADALSRDFEVDAHTGDLIGLVDAIALRAAEVVVLEDSPGAGNLLTLCRRLKETWPDVPVVITGRGLADETVFEAIQLDVSGIVAGEPVDAVVECVRRVLRGELWFDPPLVRRAIRSLAERPVASRAAVACLTPRQAEIVRLAGRGLSNKEIGCELLLTEGTIKVHLHQVFKKLRVRNRRELAVRAREKGLV